MITIFDGFDQLSDDEIRGQIALLRCVTLANSFRGVVQLVNVRKMIEDCYFELRDVEREELNLLLNRELIKKTHAISAFEIKREEYLREELHVRVVREAARTYMIDEYRTPGQQADEIREQFYEHYLKVLLRKLGRMTEDENGKLEMQIQKAIAQSNIQAVRQLASDLMLREFNGKTVRMKIVAEGNTKSLKKVIDVMGMGMFDGMETVISTIHDSVLMFCRMERAVLAQCVWTAVNGYGKRMSLNDDLMPSYSDGLAQEENEKERLLLILIAKEAELNKTLRRLLSEIDRLNKQLVIREENHEREKGKLEQVKLEYQEALERKEIVLSGGEQIKKNYEEYLRTHPVKNNSDMEYRRKKQEYENLARNVRNAELVEVSCVRNISRLEESLEKQKDGMKEIEKNLAALREELVSNVQVFNEVIMQLENEAGYRAQVLRRKWNSFYKTLRFDRKIYENVVKCFTQREIVAIERLLKEMDDSDEKAIFAHKTSGTDSITFCQTGAGKYAEIVYNDSEILQIQVKGKQR